MPTRTPILGLYNPEDPDDANTAVRVWRTADNAVLDDAVGTARQSLVVNGGMEVWQRGPGPFSANLAYAADRWRISLSGSSTMSVSRDSANADVGSEYCAAITYVHNVASNIQQVVEPFAQLRGRTCTFSCRVRTSVPSAVRLSLYDSVNLHRYSGYHTGGGAYETLTVTAPIAAATTAVWVLVYLSASATVYLDSATLCVGASPLAYGPTQSADEMARCLRYYERVGGGASGTEVIQIGALYTTTQGRTFHPWVVPKAVTPTVTITGSFNVFGGNAAAVATSAASAFGTTTRNAMILWTLSSALTAGWAIEVSSVDANSIVVVEGNP